MNQEDRTALSTLTALLLLRAPKKVLEIALLEAAGSLVTAGMAATKKADERLTEEEQADIMAVVQLEVLQQILSRAVNVTAEMLKAKAAVKECLDKAGRTE